MTQYQRMVAGLLYNPSDEEILRMQAPYRERLWAFNQLSPSHVEEKTAYMKETFAECGDHCYLESPFYANWGGKHVHFGSGIYANSNLTLVDDGHIYVGDRVMFGPNVTIVTAAHPIDPSLRRQETQFNRDVHIGENVWFGAGVIVLPGVTIGKNSVIGAGSVVTRDVPENSLAFGNPCRVHRQIGERDREFYFREDRIDWDAMREEGMIADEGAPDPKGE